MNTRTIKPLIVALSLVGSHFLLQVQAAVKTSPYEFIGPKETIVQAEIGAFEVPENRNNPDSKKIELKFVKFPSTSENPGVPIVYLAGGPGGSATGTAKRQRFPLFMKLREVADVILYDQRGTGLSKYFDDCQVKPPALEVPSEWAVLIEKTRTDLRNCVAQWQNEQIDLNGYNTKESAQDLVALTKALGVPKIDLWGISYGTHLAFATAKYHPEIVNRMVLASSEGMDHTIKRPARVQELIEQVDTMLKMDPATKNKYPDLMGDIEHVVNTLENNPVVVETRNPRSGKPMTVGIGKLDIQFALSFVFLRDPDQLVKMPRMFKDMKAGKYQEIAAYVGFIKGYLSSHNPMSVAMDAASGISDSRWKLVLKEAESALVGRTTNFPSPDINNVIPVDILDDEFREEVVSDIPTLFFAGTVDGRTLYKSQKEIANNFEHSAFITVQGAGHNLFMSHPDITTSIVDFLSGERVTDSVISLPKLAFE